MAVVHNPPAGSPAVFARLYTNTAYLLYAAVSGCTRLYSCTRLCVCESTCRIYCNQVKIIIRAIGSSPLVHPSVRGLPNPYWATNVLGDSSDVILEMPLQFSYAEQLMQTQGQIPVMGVFRLNVTTLVSGAQIQPIEAKSVGEWTENMSEVSVAAVICPYENQYPSAEGNACLFSWCTEGKEPSNTSTSCVLCEPGRFSGGNAPCEQCPGGRSCGSEGCTECGACSSGTVSSSDFGSCSVCPDAMESGSDGIHCVCQAGYFSFGNNSEGVGMDRL